MALVRGEPQDIIEGKSFRWIKIWVTEGGSCWVSSTLARLWALDQNLDPSKTQEAHGFLFRKEKDLRVYRPDLDQIHELGHELEVQGYEEKVHARALAKLSMEERKVLGL